MFATKKELLQWCKFYLLLDEESRFVSPLSHDYYPRQAIPVRTGKYWKIAGWSEEYLWEIEGHKEGCA